MNLTPEEKAIGKDNFQAAIGSEHTRRDFLKGHAGRRGRRRRGLGAIYFGYGKGVRPRSAAGRLHRHRRRRERAAGGMHAPDTRHISTSWRSPTSGRTTFIARFTATIPAPTHSKRRRGLMAKYGWKTEDEAGEARQGLRRRLHDCSTIPNVEAVIIALPLHLHAAVAIEAMKAGKHVMTEKLMAHSVAQCKEMARVAKETGKILAVGHQRHYSILYDNAR